MGPCRQEGHPAQDSLMSGSVSIKRGSEDYDTGNQGAVQTENSGTPPNNNIQVSYAVNRTIWCVATLDAQAINLIE